ncbi:MAG: phosphoribulokinase [Methanomicrobiales archaeon]|nr:phosphoribulokinase [Methanomicrobiales archaeon]
MTGTARPEIPPDQKGQPNDPPPIFVIGIAGDSGSGKTTFSRGIRSLFGERMVSTISLDDYHILDRSERREKGITPLDPRANDFARLEGDLADLRQGKPIRKPVYDHTDGTIKSAIPFFPKRILILEGLHPFATPALRRHIDFAIFVDPEPGVKRLWKIQRDMEKRGYRKDEVLEELSQRARDYERYVAPQKIAADAIIRVSFSWYGEDLGPLSNIYRVSLQQRKVSRVQGDPRLSLDLPALLALAEKDFSIEFSSADMEGILWGVLTFDGELPRNAAQTLQERVCASTIEEVLPCHRTSLTAGELVQLILAWEIFGRLEHGTESVSPAREQ